MGHGFIFFSIQSIYLDILAKILTTSGLLVVVSFWKEALDRGIIPVTLWPWTHFPIKSRGGVPAFAIRFLQGYMQRERQLHVSWLMGSPLCCNLHFLSETTKNQGPLLIWNGFNEKMGKLMIGDSTLNFRFRFQHPVLSLKTKSHPQEMPLVFLFRLVGYSRRSTPKSYKWSHIPYT